MEMKEVSKEPIEVLEEGHRVSLPRHLAGGTGRRVGVIVQIIPADNNPFHKESAIVEIFRPYGNYLLGKIIIALDELSRERVHNSCPTCECRPKEPLINLDEEIDDDDDDDEEP